MKSNVTTTQLGAEVLDALISWNLLYGTELSFTLYGEGYGAQYQYFNKFIYFYTMHL